MNIARSDDLLRDQQSRVLHEPPPYIHRPDIQGLFRFNGAIPILLLGFIALGVLELLLPSKWYFWFGPLIALYFSYRAFYTWRHEERYADTHDGVLLIREKQHPFVLFFITGSDDDTIPIDDVNLTTPTRTFFDAYVFKCCTLVIGKRKIRDVVHVKELRAIQRYRQSLSRHEVELSQDNLDVGVASLQNLEQMVRLLTDIRDQFSSSTQEAYARGVEAGRTQGIQEVLSAQSALKLTSSLEEPPS